MALIVFFRGINVGGHRAFRPSVLAKELGIYDAVNVGAAGTLVVRKPGLRAKFLAEVRRKLPFETTIALKRSRELLSVMKMIRYLSRSRGFGAPAAVPRPMPATRSRLRGVGVLIWFSKFADKFLRFLHSLFVERGTDKDFLLSHAHMFLDALLRQKQR
jgi:hypothetical protein